MIDARGLLTKAVLVIAIAAALAYGQELLLAMNFAARTWEMLSAFL